MGAKRVETGRGRRAGLVKSRSNKPFLIGMAAIVIIGGGAIATLASRKSRPITEVDMRGDPTQARGYIYGDTTAPVQIIEFADFECPACGMFATITEPDVRSRLVDTKQAYVRFFDYPLPMHRNTWFASHAAACADEQGKFWQMHDRLFAGQDQWNGEATSRPNSVFSGYAKELGLNQAQFDKCLDDRKYQSRIASNRAEAERRQVSQTPTFIIGNKMIPGALGYDDIKKAVDAAAGSPASTAAPSVPTGPRPPITTAPRQ
jgi:protein-disulfide isomerase